MSDWYVDLNSGFYENRRQLTSANSANKGSLFSTTLQVQPNEGNAGVRRADKWRSQETLIEVRRGTTQQYPQVQESSALSDHVFDRFEKTRGECA